jgi:F-type H+-transporting ATPase subunit b
MHFDPWTLALQAANFLVLLWLLHRFLYRPVLAIIAERQAATDKLVEGVKADRRALDAERADLQRREAELADRADGALTTARDAAQAEREALLASARKEAEAVRAEARKSIEHERAEAARAAGRDAARLAGAMARRLLGDGDGAVVQARLLDRVLADVRDLPDEAKRGVVERLGAKDAALVVTTAVALDQAEAERFSQRLSEILGATAEPAFQVDPALIAGVEIRFPFTVVRRAWADSLSRMETEIADDEPAADLT